MPDTYRQPATGLALRPDGQDAKLQAERRSRTLRTLASAVSAAEERLDEATKLREEHIAAHGLVPASKKETKWRKKLDKFIKSETTSLKLALQTQREAQPKSRVLPALPSDCKLHVTHLLAIETFEAWRMSLEGFLRRSLIAQVQEGVFCWSQALPLAIVLPSNSKDDGEERRFLYALTLLPWDTALARARERFIRVVSPLHHANLFFDLSHQRLQSVTTFNAEFNSLVRNTFSIQAPDDSWMSRHRIYLKLYLDKLHITLRKPLATDKRFLEASTAGLKEVQVLAVLIAQELQAAATGLSEVFAGSSVHSAVDATPEDKKKNKKSAKRKDRDGGGSGTATAGSAEVCSRCSKRNHSAPNCKSVYRADGQRLQNKPPGLSADDWNQFKFRPCRSCSSLDHQSHGCPKKVPPVNQGLLSNTRGAQSNMTSLVPPQQQWNRQPQQQQFQPGVRAVHLPQQGTQVVKEEAHVTFQDGNHTYGCTLCGLTGHTTSNCLHNPANQLQHQKPHKRLKVTFPADNVQ